MRNFILLLLIISFTNIYSQLIITQNISPSQYVSQVIAGSGVTIINATYTGDSVAIGKFQMFGSSILGTNTGVLMTTGNATNAIGPSNSGSTSFDNTGMSDPQLDSLVTGQINDAAVLEFDFIPISDTIKLSFVFASEEYPEFSLSNYSDVIGLFLTGNNPNGINYLNYNMGVIPGTTTPINVNTINNGTTNSGPCINCAYYIGNSSGTKIAYDGLTTEITVWAIVNPCETYHFKIAIADVADASYDSGIFIKQGGFISTGTMVQKPEICNVGIDSSFLYNRIILENLNSSIFDSINIYRESSVSGVYDFINTLPNALNSVYIDSSSNPQQNSYRYKVSSFDRCNGETDLSHPHKTMLLDVSAGINDEWKLEWSPSEGSAKYSYKIYRGTDSLNMQLLAQFNPTIINFTDTFHQAGKLFYQIEAVQTYHCYVDTISQSIYPIYSNIVSVYLNPGIGINESVNNNNSLNIYPNPNNGSFTIEYYTSNVNINQMYNIEIYNVLGEKVYLEEIKAAKLFKQQIQTNNLSKGVYFIQLRGDGNNISSKIIIK